MHHCPVLFEFCHSRLFESIKLYPIWMFRLGLPFARLMRNDSISIKMQLKCHHKLMKKDQKNSHQFIHLFVYFSVLRIFQQKYFQIENFIRFWIVLWEISVLHVNYAHNSLTKKPTIHQFHQIKQFRENWLILSSGQMSALLSNHFLYDTFWRPQTEHFTLYTTVNSVRNGQQIKFEQIVNIELSAKVKHKVNKVKGQC